MLTRDRPTMGQSGLNELVPDQLSRRPFIRICYIRQNQSVQNSDPGMAECVQFHALASGDLIRFLDHFGQRGYGKGQIGADDVSTRPTRHDRPGEGI